MARAVPSWTSYRATIGDRSSLFSAVRDTWGAKRALYPGCYLDLAPSTAIPEVTYVDTDRRAARFFADQDLLDAELSGRVAAEQRPGVRFVHADFTGPLPVADGAFDLLISLYTGPAWDHCRRYLRPGGLFLANSSHGDAGLAALDPDLELVAVAHQSADGYHLEGERLDRYLVPTRPADADADLIRRSGRGIGYTRSAFAYLFRLSAPR